MKLKNLTDQAAYYIMALVCVVATVVFVVLGALTNGLMFIMAGVFAIFAITCWWQAELHESSDSKKPLPWIMYVYYRVVYGKGLADSLRGGRR